MNARRQRTKLYIVLLTLVMAGHGFCTDYTQHEDFGVKKAGDIISFTVTPPGKVLTGEQVDPGDYPWSGGPVTWSWTIPPVNAGVHNGFFRGTYQPPGTGPGPSREYTWKADTKVEVSEIAPPQPEQGWWDCTRISDGAWFGGFGTNWVEVKRRAKDEWGQYSSTSWRIHGAPYSISYATYYVPPVLLYGLPDNFDYLAGYEVRNGKYYMGPFPTNVAHATIVQARSVKYGSEFSSQGAIGPENVWVKIIDVTNSYAEWEVSAEYGSLSIPLDPPHEPWTDITNTLNGRGNTTETTNEVWQSVLKVDIEQSETNVCMGGANVVLNLTADSYLDKGTANWSSEPAGISGSGRSISFSPNTLTPGTYTVTAQSSLQPSCRDTCLVRVLKVEITPSTMNATESLDSGTFTCTVTPSGLSPTYQWLTGSANDAWPATAGNNPELDCSASTASSTIVNETRWFAPTPDRRQAVDGTSCCYNVNCKVTVGGVKCRASTPATLSVTVDMTGQTRGATFTNWDTITVAETGGIWQVTGQGNFSRSTPVASVNMPATSQFYNKAMVHENKHVEQWMTGMFKDLNDANALYNSTLSALTSINSEADLRGKILTAVFVQFNADDAICHYCPVKKQTTCI